MEENVKILLGERVVFKSPGITDAILALKPALVVELPEPPTEAPKSEDE